MLLSHGEPRGLSADWALLADGALNYVVKDTSHWLVERSLASSRAHM